METQTPNPLPVAGGWWLAVAGSIKPMVFQLFSASLLVKPMVFQQPSVADSRPESVAGTGFTVKKTEPHTRGEEKKR